MLQVKKKNYWGKWKLTIIHGRIGYSERVASLLMNCNRGHKENLIGLSPRSNIFQTACPSYSSKAIEFGVKCFIKELCDKDVTEWRGQDAVALMALASLELGFSFVRASFR